MAWERRGRDAEGVTDAVDLLRGAGESLGRALPVAFLFTGRCALVAELIAAMCLLCGESLLRGELFVSDAEEMRLLGAGTCRLKYANSRTAMSEGSLDSGRSWQILAEFD